MKKRESFSGFTLIELLVSTTIFSLLLVAATYFLTGQGSSYTGQKQRLAVEDDARSALDYVTRMLKGATAMPAMTGMGATCSTSVTFYYNEAFGNSTGSNSATTLNDTSQAWTANQWTNYLVVITSGSGSGQVQSITSNTAARLTVSSTWTTIPDSTSLYKIVSKQQFSQSGTALTYQNVSTGSGTAPLADNITCFTVQQDATYTTRYIISLTAQTAQNLPDTGKPGTTVLQSSISVRN